MKFSPILIFLAATFALTRAQVEQTGLRKGAKGDKPAKGEKPAKADKPAKGEKTAKGDKPAKGKKPAKGGKPAKGDKPAKGEKPAKEGEEPEEEEVTETICPTVSELNEAIAKAADAIPQISKAYFDAGGGKAGKALVDACQAAYNTAVATIDTLYEFSADVPDSGQNYDLRNTRSGFLSYLLGTECLTIVGKATDQFPDGNIDGTMFQEYGFGIHNFKKNRGWNELVTWSEDNFDYDLNCNTPGAMGEIEYTSVTFGVPIMTANSFGFNYGKNGRVAITSQQISPEEDLAGISCTENCNSLLPEEI